MVDTTTRVCTVVNTLPGGIPRSPDAVGRPTFRDAPRSADDTATTARRGWGLGGTGDWSMEEPVAFQPLAPGIQPPGEG